MCHIESSKIVSHGGGAQEWLRSTRVAERKEKGVMRNISAERLSDWKSEAGIPDAGGGLDFLLEIQTESQNSCSCDASLSNNVT